MTDEHVFTRPPAAPPPLPPHAPMSLPTATQGWPDALARAQRELVQAKSAERAATLERRKATRTMWLYTARYWAARSRIPGWAAWLVTATALSLALAGVQIFAFESGLGLVWTQVLSCFAICGAVSLALFRSQPGETDANRLRIRSEQRVLAGQRRELARQTVKARAAATSKAHEALMFVRHVLQSEQYKFETETQRLLSIDGGRLYPDEFERYVAAIFAHLGYAVDTTGQSGDQGVDVVACKGPLRVAVQAKRYQGSVGNGAVQEVYAGMVHRQCHRCIVVTNSEFTSSAIALARSTGCILIGADKIPALIRGEIAI